MCVYIYIYIYICNHIHICILIYICIYIYIYTCGSCADEGMAEALLELGCSIFDDGVWGADVVIRVGCGGPASLGFETLGFGLWDQGLTALTR